MEATSYNLRRRGIEDVVMFVKVGAWSAWRDGLELARKRVCRASMNYVRPSFVSPQNSALKLFLSA